MTYRFLQLYFRWTRKDLLHHVGYLPSVEKNNSTGKGITRLLTRLLAGKLKLCMHEWFNNYVELMNILKTKHRHSVLENRFKNLPRILGQRDAKFSAAFG